MQKLHKMKYKSVTCLKQDINATESKSYNIDRKDSLKFEIQANYPPLSLSNNKNSYYRNYCFILFQFTIVAERIWF